MSPPLSTAAGRFAALAAFFAAALAFATPSRAQIVFEPLFAVLNGGNECVLVVATTTCRKGDLDAFGSVTVVFPTATSLCYAILADNLAGATLAHIHRGPSGVVGGIVVNLTPPVAPGGANPGGTSGCVAVAAGLITLIRDDPTSFYVNVHNVAFPAGAIRGQLF